MTKIIKKIYRGPKYPTKVDGKIPAFNSYEEEANFWDTHAVTDFDAQTENVDIIFELEKPKEESLMLRINRDMKRKLEKVAKKKKINVSTLSRLWLAEKLQTI